MKSETVGTLQKRFAAWPRWKRVAALLLPMVVVFVIGEVAGRWLEQYAGYIPRRAVMEQRINFLLRISRLEPDAILIYYGNNDLNWSWVPDPRTKLIYGRGEAISPPGWFDRSIDHSYVLMEIRSRMNLLNRSSRVKHDDVDPAAIELLEGNLRGLVGDARRANVKVALATFAHGLDETGAADRYTADETTLGVPTNATLSRGLLYAIH